MFCKEITSRSAVPSLLKKSVANVGTPVAASTSIEKWAFHNHSSLKFLLKHFQIVRQHKQLIVYLESLLDEAPKAIIFFMFIFVLGYFA
jgi:hypothetical protein